MMLEPLGSEDLFPNAKFMHILVQKAYYFLEITVIDDDDIVTS